MTDVIQINQPIRFSLEHANELLPIIRRWTAEAQKKIEPMIEKMEAVRLESPQQARELEAEVDRNLVAWQTKIKKLGARVGGLWIVDFDNGRGLWTWRFPEAQVGYWREYGQSLEQGIPLEELPEELYPTVIFGQDQ